MPPALLPAHIRARGSIHAAFARTGNRTAIASVHEAGGLRLRFPRVAGGCEAVIVNTGGGIAGGDSQTLSFEAAEGTSATITTQSAEKVYRAQDGTPAEVHVSLRLASGSALEWLPQETILFDQARLTRRLDADLAPDAVLTVVESVIFGRLAMGESSVCGLFRDRWRVRRGGTLAFAEDLKLEGAQGEILDRPALGKGARACATLLHMAADAETHLDAVRAALAAQDCEAGASAWDGKLVVRAVSPSPERLRAAIMAATSILRGRDAPRVWQM